MFSKQSLYTLYKNNPFNLKIEMEVKKLKANQKFRLPDDKTGNIEMITMGIVAAVMFAIAIPIVFNVLGSLNITTVDTNLRTAMGETAGFTPAANATNNLLTQVNSFFSIGPIYLVVVVAVGIIAAILVLRRFT
jgi:hypothetical protein